MALITRIKLQLNDEERFSSFRDDSSKFLRGDLDAKAYHSLLVSHGLVNLAADLASLCPDTTRRQELTLAHSSFLTLAASSSSSTTRKSWVPPEAAAAMKAELDIKTKINSSWTCGICTLVNAPGISRCEACGSLSPEARQGGLTEDFPALGPSSAAPTSVAQPAGKLNTKKGKGVVLTLGLQRGGTKGFETAPPPPPPSAWGSR